jgi:hypothetical protein
VEHGLRASGRARRGERDVAVLEQNVAQAVGRRKKRDTAEGVYGAGTIVQVERFDGADRRPVSGGEALEELEVPPGFEPGMEVLQTSALPLGYGTRLTRKAEKRGLKPGGMMERETGFEPATSTLARSHSTTELFPLALATA